MAEAAARFKIGTKTYKLDPNLDKVSLLDIITFDEEVAAAGLHATWGQMLAWSGEVAALPDEQRTSHPRGFFVLAATIWASRRLSGEQVNFGDMLRDLSLNGLEWLESSAATGPKDHLPKKKSTRTRKASAPAVPVEDEA